MNEQDPKIAEEAAEAVMSAFMKWEAEKETQLKGFEDHFDRLDGLEEYANKLKRELDELRRLHKGEDQ